MQYPPVPAPDATIPTHYGNETYLILGREERTELHNVLDVAEAFAPYFDGVPHSLPTMAALFVNHRGQVIAAYHVSHSPEVNANEARSLLHFLAAQLGARRLVLARNSATGSQPTTADHVLLERMQMLCAVPVADFLIFRPDGWSSFDQLGLMPA